MQELNHIHLPQGLKEKAHQSNGMEAINQSSENWYQRELPARLRQQELLADLGRQALAKISAEELTDKVVAFVTQGLDARFAEVLLQQAHSEELSMVAGFGWGENLILGARFDINEATQPAYTLRVNSPVIVDDLQTEERFSSSNMQSHYGVASGISVPLGGPLSAFGVLSVYSTKAGQFSREDAHFLQAAANILAQAIERDHLAEAKRLSDSRFQQIVNSDMVGVLFWSRNGEITDANNLFLEMIGYSREDLQTGKLLWQQITPPEYLHLDEAAIKELAVSGTCKPFEKEYIKKDGGRISVLLGASVLDGFADRGICFVIDTTERHQAENALRKSIERLDLSQQAGKIGCFEWDFQTRRCVLSEELEALYGLQPGEFGGRYEDWAALIEPEDLSGVLEDFNRSLKDGEFISEWRIILPGGDKRWVNTRAKLFYDDQGNALRMVGVNMDVTEHKEAETERRNLEAQLLQSQKMESIGRLAGGVAHDFNNLLTAILGYSQLLQRRVGANEALLGEISEVIKAAQRAENLTRQLLAFSRKQTLQPKVIDINYVITDLNKMLSRLIHEDIDLITNLKPDLWRVKVDPGQLEQVIVNLVINARDAMPTGGRINIATSHLTIGEAAIFKELRIEPGNYIRITIKDTGCGMDTNTRAHIFEPFFTTKESGKGTGLGLATVYGVVKQSGGHITVHSKVNQGTTFTIYLPSVAQNVEAMADGDNADSPLPGSETILLAEDDQFVRTLSARVLRDQGYTVIETNNGEDALRLVRDNDKQVIHLLVTDVIMPRMGGKQLSEEVKRLRPDIKILYTSGYVDTALLDYGVLDTNIPFLQKPFTPLSLARTVHEALGHK
jgi:two-component system, cell cycle sensor histidine kinase and response regulator CckA